MGKLSKIAKALDTSRAARLKRAADQGFIGEEVFTTADYVAEWFKKEGYEVGGFATGPSGVARSRTSTGKSAYIPISYTAPNGKRMGFEIRVSDHGTGVNRSGNYKHIQSSEDAKRIIDEASKYRASIDPDYRATNAAFDPANIGKNDLLGQVDPKLLAPLAATGATVEFARRRAEQGSDIAAQWVDGYKAAATLASSLAGGVVGDLSRLGGAINPFITPEQSEQGAQALQDRLTYIPEGQNKALNAIGTGLGTLGEDIQRGADALNFNESAPKKLYDLLPARAKLAADPLMELLF